MKRKTIIMQSLVILAIVVLGLFVSCSGNIMDDKVLENDTLVYATFDKNNSRATSTYTQTVTLKEISDVYWTYTATKKDNAGKKGETSTQTAVGKDFGKGLSNVIGPFSQGLWGFEVFGYTGTPADTAPSGTEGKDYFKVVQGNSTKYYTQKVYYGKTTSSVELKNGTENNPDPINIVINLLQEGKGTFSIVDTSSFKWESSGGDVADTTDSAGPINMYLKLEGRKQETKSQSDYVKLAYVSGNASTSAYYEIAEEKTVGWDETDAGSFYLTCYIVRAKATTTESGSVSYSDLNVYASSPEMLVKVYTGQTTTLEAKIIEGNFAYGIINGTIEGTDLTTTTTVTTTITSADTMLSSSITPASVSSGSISTGTSTTVTIPNTVSAFESGKTASLTISATPIVTANSTYIVSESTGAVGAIEMSAAVIDSKGNSTSVEKFEDSKGNAVAVTVVTYIAKGMSGVTVTYNGDGAAPTDITYDSATGKLTYKTTHFSTFLVGADQNVYDMSTNTAYTLTSEGKIKDLNNNEKTVTDLGSSLVLFDCSLSNKVLDEWIKSYDNENGKTWEVVHNNCKSQKSGYWHEEADEYFSSGYGTKLEPYMIASKKQLANITKMASSYNECDGAYAYYKIDDNYPDSDKDFSDFSAPITLGGSFDGDGLVITELPVILFGEVVTEKKTQSPADNTKDTYTIKNLTINANITGGWSCAVVSEVGVGNFVMKNVIVHGYIEGSVKAASFVNFGPGDYYDGFQYAGKITFINCYSDALLVAKSENAVGFICHAMMNASGEINLIESEYDGVMSSVKGFMYVDGNGTGAKIKIRNSSSGSQIEQDYEYSKEGKTNTLLRDSIKISSLSKNKGDTVEIKADTTATEAMAELVLTPGPGSYVGVYMEENLSLDDGKFSTNNIKYFDVALNPEGVTKSGADGNTYNLVHNGSTELSSDSIIRITQYAGKTDKGYKIPIHITDVSLEDKTDI